MSHHFEYIRDVLPDFDEKFVEQLLRNKGKLQESNEVVQIEPELLRTGGNTGNKLYRLKISYKVEEADLPSSVVLKLCDTGILSSPNQRDHIIERLIVYSSGLSDVNLLLREILFYQKYTSLITEPIGVNTPEIYFADITYGSSTILSKTMYILFRRKEQVKGAIIMEDLSSGRIMDAVEESSRMNIIRLCGEIGRLYGYTAKVLHENDGVLAPGMKPPAVLSYRMMFMTNGIPKMIKKRWSPSSGVVNLVHERWGSTEFEIMNKDPDVLQALLALEQHFVPSVYSLHDNLWDYLCVIQGDFHAGNFMIMPGGHIKMYDMQMWGKGHPADELAYFLASNVEPNEENDDLALRAVHRAMEMTNENAVPYPLDQLKRDVDVCTLHYLGATMVRRAFYDTPEEVDKLVEKQGSVQLGVQRILTVREERLMLRTKRIWQRDPTFRLTVEEAEGGGKEVVSS